MKLSWRKSEEEWCLKCHNWCPLVAADEVDVDADVDAHVDAHVDVNIEDVAVGLQELL